MSDEKDDSPAPLTVAYDVPFVGYEGEGVACINNGSGLIRNETVSINHDRFMTVPLKVHYRDQLHEFSLPAECTLKELYQALSKQLAGIDPNGEIMLERQAEATYEVNLPPGTY
ncbi:hypothetical protein D9M68_20030 [compost metagenome]